VVFARDGAPADLPWANRISRRAREESWMKCGVEGAARSRENLLARRHTLEWNVVLQGPQETVFFDC
jgi:hypothetical protein